MLRTEGIGQLSVVVFLCHYTLFHYIRGDTDWVIQYCDNMGVVKQIQWAEMRSVLTPSECLKADADVILQIEAIYEELGCNTVTQHIKGHQY
eukprot:12740821-Ditylum_brightwellii.AAC.1